MEPFLGYPGLVDSNLRVDYKLLKLLISHAGATLDGNDAVCFATVLPNCDVTNVKTTVIKAVAELAKEGTSFQVLSQFCFVSLGY